MAQCGQVGLTDYSNGEVAQETVRFGLNGSDHEIGLTADNASELRSTLSL
ncbi:Lsr2 dimerization domain-containing protein [Arthrobacter sp. Soc17.1.1.1]